MEAARAGNRRIGASAHRRIGVSVYRCIGVSVYRCIGGSVYRCIGVLPQFYADGPHTPDRGGPPDRCIYAAFTFSCPPSAGALVCGEWKTRTCLRARWRGGRVFCRKWKPCGLATHACLRARGAGWQPHLLKSWGGVLWGEVFCGA